jgi:hypothetical protein
MAVRIPCGERTGFAAVIVRVATKSGVTGKGIRVPVRALVPVFVKGQAGEKW